MKSLFKILKEERSSLLKTIILTIVATLIFGYAMSNPYIEHLPFGVVDRDNSNLSRTIVQQLKISPGLNVNYYANSDAELEKAIKDRRVNGGIIIPKHFEKDISMAKSPSALLLIDGTDLPILSNILAYASQVLGTVNAGAQISVLQGNGMVPYQSKQTVLNFSYVERVLYEPQSSYLRYLIYTLIPLVNQGFFVPVLLVPALMKKKEQFAHIKMRSKEGIKAILGLIGRLLLYSTLCIIVIFTCLCIVDKLFCVPLRGDILIYIVLMSLFFINLTAMGLALTSFMDNLGHFILFFNLINIVIFLTCGVVMPDYLLPSGMPEALNSLWPFRHMTVALKMLSLKGLSWDLMLPYLQNELNFGAFWLPVGLAMYAAKIAFMKYKNSKLLQKA
ncbi:ABC transporter permease [Clostridium coskatii]|uniref:Inner membrane transport permease YbhR n=1 Tax=Clostridium coskatii TaxID=1705578 RepID=A0A168R5S8_9CLOT|nr:ABC transporter permease [Clostridium coskatii]OAA90081.1 Inner membrane transport permease YbhR [Clostridium coskatii]OBR92723.1 inner membrane transport permease YbhR [Clostridium coskatii]